MALAVEIICAALLAGGAAFMLITAAGLFRMPDFFLRMHVVTKAGTLGVGLIFLAVAVFFGHLGATTRALATIVFVLLTSPVSAHMIGRAGYLDHVPMWEGTLLDELHGLYNPDEDAPDGRASTQQQVRP